MSPIQLSKVYKILIKSLLKVKVKVQNIKGNNLYYFQKVLNQKVKEVKSQGENKKVKGIQKQKRQLLTYKNIRKSD